MYNNDGRTHRGRRSEKTCYHKTIRGNVFVNKVHADSAVRRIRRHGGEQVVSYHCQICGLWHIGNRAKHKKKILREREVERGGKES